MRKSWFDSDTRWLRLAAPAAVLAAWLVASVAQQGTPPSAGTPPAGTPPAGTPPAGTPAPSTPPASPRPAAPEEREEAAGAPTDEAADKGFTPSEELQPDAAVTFPVDI
jgi:hypothetical protein